MIGWLDRHVSGCWTSVCLSIGVKIVLFILFLCHASIIFFSIIKIILYKAIIKQRVKFSFLNYEYYFHISLFYYFSLLSNEEERKKDTSNAHLRWAVSNRAFTLLLLDFFFLFLYSLFFVLIGLLSSLFNCSILHTGATTENSNLYMVCLQVERKK